MTIAWPQLLGAGVRVDERFSTKEAAVLAGLSEKAIRHEMAREIARPESVRTGKAVRRAMDARDIFYLSLVGSLPIALAPRDRRDLYDLIRRRLAKSGRWRATARRLRLRGEVAVDIDPSRVRRDVKRRVRIFARGRRRIAVDANVAGGEVVFAGTRIPIRHIGLLAKKAAVKEILEDYPALDREDVEFARFFVELRPDPGRPRKALAFRRAAG